MRPEEREKEEEKKKEGIGRILQDIAVQQEAHAC